MNWVKGRIKKHHVVKAKFHFFIWLIDWLIDWLHDWLIFCLFVSAFSKVDALNCYNCIYNISHGAPVHNPRCGDPFDGEMISTEECKEHQFCAVSVMYTIVCVSASIIKNTWQNEYLLAVNTLLSLLKILATYVRIVGVELTAPN